jgi:hypothetical protein
MEGGQVSTIRFIRARQSELDESKLDFPNIVDEFIKCN